MLNIPPDINIGNHAMNKRNALKAKARLYHALPWSRLRTSESNTSQPVMKQSEPANKKTLFTSQTPSCPTIWLTICAAGR